MRFGPSPPLIQDQGSHHFSPRRKEGDREKPPKMISAADIAIVRGCKSRFVGRGNKNGARKLQLHAVVVFAAVGVSPKIWQKDWERSVIRNKLEIALLLRLPLQMCTHKFCGISGGLSCCQAGSSFSAGFVSQWPLFLPSRVTTQSKTSHSCMG